MGTGKGVPYIYIYIYLSIYAHGIPQIHRNDGTPTSSFRGTVYMDTVYIRCLNKYIYGIHTYLWNHRHSWAAVLAACSEEATLEAATRPFQVAVDWPGNISGMATPEMLQPNPGVREVVAGFPVLCRENRSWNTILWNFQHQQTSLSFCCSGAF